MHRQHEFMPRKGAEWMCGYEVKRKSLPDGAVIAVCGLPDSASVHQGVEERCEFTCHDPSYKSMCAVPHRCVFKKGHVPTEHRTEDFEGHVNRSPQPPAKTIEQLAGEIAEAVYHGRDFPTGDLRDLLIQFAEETQRRSVEP